MAAVLELLNRHDIGKDDPDGRRLAAAERRREAGSSWRGRLGDLASRLMADGHPAAQEVAFDF